MSQYFPKPYKQFVGHINVKVDLSNYATKTDVLRYFSCCYYKFCIKNKFSKSKN